MLGTQTVLGLAIDESGVAVSELRVRAGRREIRRAARFPFTERLGPETPEELGRQFRQFLRANRFSARQVAVGIPAQWVVAREIVVPPAKPEALSGILRIQAERAFSLSANELVFDYSYCKGCGVCVAECPRNVIFMSHLGEVSGCLSKSSPEITPPAMP